jgi:hypothetical protein
VRPVLVVVANVFAHESLQMPFIEDDHLFEEISSATSNPTLRNTVLPRTAKGSASWLAPDVPHNRNHIDSKTLSLGRVIRIGAAVCRPTLLAIASDPDSVGVLGHIEAQDLTPVVADHEKAMQNTNVRVGTVKKSSQQLTRDDS